MDDRIPATTTTRIALAALVCAATLSISASAHAADPESQPYAPSLETSIVSYPYDSDWVPANSPLQFRLQAAFLDEVRAEMEGEATYDWDDETLVFEGTAGQGSFAYEIGVELTASVQIDIAGLIIPADVVGPIDLKLPTSVTFDPYLLEGNPDRPADASTTLTVNAIDQALDFGMAATGNIHVDVQVDFIGLNFQSNQLDVSENEMGAAVLTTNQEGEVFDYILEAPVEPETVDLWALLTSEMNAETSIHLLPSVSVTPTGGAPITVGPFDLDVNFPVVNAEPLIFPLEQIPFEGPTQEPPGETGGGESGDGDDGGGESTESGESGTETSGESSTETGDPGQTTAGDGCDCRSSAGGRGSASFLLLGLLVWRRRRLPSD
jgi:hypothetical protein